jgi:PKD repeat protein
MVNNWLCLPVVVGMLLLVSCVQAAPVTNGLVAYYDGNLSGNSLVDLSGNNNAGYATSVTSGTNQLTGANYVNLNGVNSKIDVSNNAQTNISSPVSIEFIGSINNFTKYGALVSKYSSGSLGWYLSSSSADPYNKARFGANTSGGLKNFESDNGLVAGQVYDIVVTYDNNVTHIYINGKDSGVRTWNSPIIGNPLNITIGYGSSSAGLKYCNCSMYVFRLYNRSLSSAEVKQNYEYDRWRYRVTPRITWSNPANITYGTALNVTQLNAVSTDPVTGSNVAGSFVYTPASGTVLSVGTHTLHADFTPSDTTNYTIASKEVIINISKATPIIIWNNPADITYGTSLSETQLNANASVPGSFFYTPPSGTILSAGTHTLHVDYTPNDAVNYTNATADVTINVSGNPILIANFTADVTSGPAPLSVQFTDLSENATAWFWDFGDGQTSTVRSPIHKYNSPGTYTVSLNVSNADGYNISTKSNLITVNSTTPLVTNGLVVYYDSSLSGNSLADLSGNNNAGYATSVTSGTNQLTGADYVNLNGVNSKIDVSNNAKTNVSSPISIEFIGSINEFKQYGALVSKYNSGGLGWYLSCSSAYPYNKARFGAGTSVGFKNFESDASLVAGQVYDIVVTYDNNITHIYINGKDSGIRVWNLPIKGSPENITIGYGSGINYCNCNMYVFRLYNRSLSSAEVKQNYEYDLWRYKVTPKITWSNPANITYGTALSSTQLNANASVPGTFVYTPAAGTVLNIGTHTLHVDFSPTDTANYTNLTANVTINVTEKVEDDITKIKKLVYGDGGLPRYMGSHAIQQSDYGLNILDKNLNIRSSTGTPFFQNNGGSLTNCSLVDTEISGVKWRNCYAPGSSAVLTYTGENRSVQDTCLLSNDSFNLNHSVTYSGQTQTVQDGVPVNGGSAYEFYGDGLNTKVSENNVILYTDNAEVQYNLLYLPVVDNATGEIKGEPVSFSYQTRNAGVTRASSLELPLSSPQLTPMPVPSGHLGALIFAEHGDYIDHDSLRTVMYGTNDTNNSIYGTKGFIGHNLAATWSVFPVSAPYGEGLDSPTLKAITDDMSNHGFEIIPHSLGASGEAYPNRTMAITYLPWYVTNYSCRNWIDHGLGNGKRNIGLKSCGWDPASPHYIMDLFQIYNISYAWSFEDRSLANGGLSTSKISSVGLPVDIIWQNTNLTFPGGTPLYQWASSYAGNRTYLYFNNNTVDNMLSTYGVCIWHDYWADNSSTDFNCYYVKSQTYMINATFDSLLTNISAQKQAGNLWNPTVSQYIDYWIAAKNVEVRCTGVNTYTVVNHNSDTLNGFSMRVTGSRVPKLDGVTLSTKTNGEDTIFWMDLPTGTHTITLEA